MTGLPFILVLLVIVGVILAFFPMDATIKRIVIAVVVVVVAIWALRALLPMLGG